MKLISVQSRGNRLARVYEHHSGYGYAFMGMTIDSDGKKYLDEGKDMVDFHVALKAAENWLGGATV